MVVGVLAVVVVLGAGAVAGAETNPPCPPALDNCVPPGDTPGDDGDEDDEDDENDEDETDQDGTGATAGGGADAPNIGGPPEESDDGSSAGGGADAPNIGGPPDGGAPPGSDTGGNGGARGDDGLPPNASAGQGPPPDAGDGDGETPDAGTEQTPPPDAGAEQTPIAGEETPASGEETPPPDASVDETPPPDAGESPNSGAGAVGYGEGGYGGVRREGGQSPPDTGEAVWPDSAPGADSEYGEPPDSSGAGARGPPAAAPGGDAGSGGMFDLGGALDDWTSGAIDRAKEGLAGAFVGAFNTFAEVSLGTPHPINDGALGVFGEPTGEGGMQEGYQDNVVGLMYPIIVGLGILFTLLAAAMALLGGVFRQYRAGELLWKLFVGAVVFTAVWAWITVHQMFAHELTMFIIPSGEEIVADPGSLAKFTAANLAVVIIMAVLGIAEAAGLLVLYGGRQVLLAGPLPYLMVGVIMLQFWGPHRYLRTLGTYIHFQWLALVYWTVPVAILLELAFSADWSASGEGLMAFVQTIALYSGALLFPIFMSTSALAIPFLISRRGAEGVSKVRESEPAAKAKRVTKRGYERVRGDPSSNGGSGWGPRHPPDRLPDTDITDSNRPVQGSSPAEVRDAVNRVDPKRPVDADWEDRREMIDPKRYNK